MIFLKNKDGSIKEASRWKCRGAKFEPAKADRAVEFIETCCHHVKGELAGQLLVLEEWQREITRGIFGWILPNGARLMREVYIEVPRKNGKMLADDTPVPTVNGWKRHGDLRPGDLIFSPTGATIPVLAVTGSYDGPGYRVEFSDGTAIVAHERHEWITERTWFTNRARGSRQPMPPVETIEMRDTLKCGARGDFVHRIKIPKAIELPPAALPVAPYALGAWLGDGHSASARLTCFDNEIVSNLEAEGVEVRATGTTGLYSLGSSRGQPRPIDEFGRFKAADGFHAKLKALGVLDAKHIPDIYLRASKSQRLALLQGLMDTDGYASKAGQCELALTSKRLFDGALELVRTLGLKPTVKIDRAKINGRDCGPRYRMQFWSFQDEPVFLLPRKSARLRQAHAEGKQRSKAKTVVAVEPVGTIRGQCIKVLGGEYLAGDGFTPTHNSTWGAAIGLYMLFADGEPGAEIYSAAADRDQATIIFGVAKGMVEAEEDLKEASESFVKSIVYEKTSSVYQVLSSDAPSKHGKNSHGILFDELHAQPNRDLYDVLKTSTGSRRQPLMIMFTTAGFDRKSICWEVHEYAKKVIDGTVDDPRFLPVIYDTEEDDDWTDPAIWAKANPNLGISIKTDYLAAECEKAKATPAYENTFRRLHLNQWTQQDVRWLQIIEWDANAAPVDIAALKGRACYAGLDLASTTDIAALVLVFPGDPFVLLPFFWIPEDNLKERVKRDRVPYDTWLRQGFLEATPGTRIDYRWIMLRLGQCRVDFNLRGVAFDRWGSQMIVTTLCDEFGFTADPVEAERFQKPILVQFGQGFASMNSPTKELLDLILARKIAHGGNPVLRWMAQNMIVKTDSAGNIKPDKGKSTEKIDGIVAAIMGLDLAIRNGGGEEKTYFWSL